VPASFLEKLLHKARQGDPLKWLFLWDDSAYTLRRINAAIVARANAAPAMDRCIRRPEGYVGNFLLRRANRLGGPAWEMHPVFNPHPAGNLPDPGAKARRGHERGQRCTCTGVVATGPSSIAD